MTLIIISCEESPKEEFSLSGTVSNFENGTVLYFDNKENLIDSTLVENNSFSFNTKLPKSPLQVVLRTKNFSNYRFLWLENRPMTFDATKSDFKHAIVTGSYEENLSQSLSKETDSLPRDKQLKKDMEFVSKNPNSLHAAYILAVYSKTWGKDKTNELFNTFSTENKNSEYGKSIAKYIQLNKNVGIGQKFVDFEMNDTNGKARKLSEYKDKVILLEFWASNCGPCRKENPNLVKTYEKYKPKGFEVYAVSEDVKKASWLKAIEKDKLPWLQVSDLEKDNSASLIYGVNGIPDNFLIDKTGVIVGRNLRGEELNNRLAELLK